MLISSALRCVVPCAFAVASRFPVTTIYIMLLQFAGPLSPVNVPYSWFCNDDDESLFLDARVVYLHNRVTAQRYVSCIVRVWVAAHRLHCISYVYVLWSIMYTLCILVMLSIANDGV